MNPEHRKQLREQRESLTAEQRQLKALEDISDQLRVQNTIGQQIIVQLTNLVSATRTPERNGSIRY